MPPNVRVEIRTRSGYLVAEGAFRPSHTGLTDEGAVELVGDCEDGRRLTVRIAGELLEEIAGPAIATSIRERAQRAEDAVLARLGL